MFNLIKKDIILSLKINIFTVIYALVISAMGIIDDNIIRGNLLYVVGIVMLTFVSAIYTNGFDDAYKSHVILNSLPINRGTIVRSKYAILIVFIVVYSALIGLFGSILSAIDIVKVKQSINIYSFIIAADFILLFYSIYYPFYFKIGEGLRSFNTILWVFIIIVPSLLTRFFKNLESKGLLGKVLEINIGKLSIYSLIIVLIIFYLSLQISTSIYMKREF